MNFPLRPTIFEKGPRRPSDRANNCSYTSAVAVETGGREVNTWAIEEYSRVDLFPDCLKIAQSSFASMRVYGTVCMRVACLVLCAYMDTMCPCVHVSCVSVPAVHVLACFVCICLQSGRSQILHIYMIQLACSIKIIYNCYNI